VVAQRETGRGAEELVHADLESLLQLSESLIGSGNIEHALVEITERMAKALAYDRCSIVLLDEGSNAGFVVAASDDVGLRNLQIDIDGYPEIKEVIRTREPLVIGDVSDSVLVEEVRAILQDRQVGSIVLFPLRLDRYVQGVFLLRRQQTRDSALTTREVRFGKIVANATAIAIRNLRLYETVKDRSERRLTERIQAERRLRQIEKYQRFFDFAGDGLVIIDNGGRILFTNRAANAILGFDEAAIRQMKLSDIVAPKTEAALEQIMEGVAEGRHQRDVDLPVLRASGEVATLSLTTSPLTGRNDTGDLPKIGESFETIISFRDVTETRRMAEELRRTKDFLVNLIDASADAIVAADMTGKIVVFNAVAEEVTGYSAGEAIGMPVTKLYPTGVAKKIMAALRSEEYGGPGKLEERRHTLITKDGESIPVNLAAGIVYDQGKEVATVGIFSDLRERLQMEEDLVNAQRKLELSERQAAVVELAGAAAHELNQPLTSIMGYAELAIRKVQADSPALPSLETMLSEAERMAEIVRKLGDITRYKTKRYLGGHDIVDLDAASHDKEENG
jgi:PAS domain S-box-containing protein